MSKKLTVIAFFTRDKDGKLATLKPKMTLASSTHQGSIIQTAGNSKGGTSYPLTQIKDASKTQMGMNQKFGSIGGREHASVTAGNKMTSEATDSEEKSIQNLFPEFFPFDDLQELKNKTLTITFDQYPILRYSSTATITIRFDQFEELKAKSYVNCPSPTDAWDWDCYFTTDKNLHAVRLAYRNFSQGKNETKLSRHSLDRDLKSLYRSSSLALFPAKLKPYLVKLGQHLAFKEDNSCMGEESLITEEEIKALCIPAAKEALKHELPSESNSDDDDPQFGELKKKFKTQMADLIYGKNCYVVNNRDDLYYVYYNIRSKLNELMATEKVENKIFLLYFAANEFIKYAPFVNKYWEYKVFSHYDQLQKQDKIDLWNSKILQLERKSTYDKYNQKWVTSFTSTPLTELITSHPTTIRLSSINFLLDPEERGVAATHELLGYYIEESHIKCPVFNFIVRSLDNRDESDFFCKDKDDFTPRFTVFSNYLVNYFNNEDTYNQLFYKLTAQDSEKSERKKDEFEERGSNELLFRFLKYCISTHHWGLGGSLFKLILDPQKYKPTVELVFDAVYTKAVKVHKDELSKVLDMLKDLLYEPFSESSMSVEFFNEMLLEKLKTKAELELKLKLELAAYYFRLATVSLSKKRAYLLDLIQTDIKDKESAGSQILQRIMNSDPAFLCAKEGLSVRIDAVLSVAEQYFKKEYAEWATELKEDKSNLEWTLSFASALKVQSGSKMTYFHFCIFLARYFHSSPEAAKNLESLRSGESNILLKTTLLIIQFINESTLTGNMTISTIETLAKEKDCLKALEDFEQTQGLKLSERVEKEDAERNRLIQTLEEIYVNWRCIEENKDKIRELPFFVVAKQDLDEFEKQYKSWTVKVAEDSDQFKNLIALSGSALADFKPLCQIDLFVAELKSSLASNLESKSCSQFIQGIQHAKTEIQRKLKEFAKDPKTMSLQVVREYFPQVLAPSQEEKHRAMLGKLGIEDSIQLDLISQSKQLIAIKNLADCAHMAKADKKGISSFSRLLQMHPFTPLTFSEKADVVTEKTGDQEQASKANIQNYPLVQNFEDFRKNFEEDNDNKDADISMENAAKWDKHNLRENLLIQNLNPHRLGQLAHMDAVISFLVEDKDKKLLIKLKEDIDGDKFQLTNMLAASYEKLKFLLENDKPLPSLLDECLRLCCNSLPEPDNNNACKQAEAFYEIVKYLINNLATLKHEKSKATGDFHKIVNGLLEDSHFIFELDPEKHTFELTAQIQQQTISEAKDNYYSAEEMNDYITKARIIEKNANSTTEKEKDQNVKEIEETEKDRYQNVKKLVRISKEIEEIQKSLLSLFETGMVNRGFNTQLIQKLISKDFLSTKEKGSKHFLCINVSKDKELTNLKDLLHNKAKDAMESYKKVIQNPEYQLITYFTQEKMDMLISWLKLSDLEKKDKTHSSGILNILKEALDLDQGKLEEQLEKVGTFDKENLKNDDLFRVVADYLSQFHADQKHAEIGEDELELGSQVCYINTEHEGSSLTLNQYDFILSLMRKQRLNTLQVAQFLYCTETISTVEILAFLNRCFRDKNLRVYFILNPAGLSPTVLSSMFAFIEEYSDKSKELNKRLIILNNLQVYDALKVDKVFAEINYDKSGKLLDKTGFEKHYESQLDSIVIVTSDHPGDGKTTWIDLEHKKNLAGPYNVKHKVDLGLIGEVNKVYIEQILTGLEHGVAQGNFDLHIKIDYIDRFNECKDNIDYLLFNILFMRKFELKGKIVDINLHLNKVYIEIGNSIKTTVIDNRGLDLIALLHQLTHLKPRLLKNIPSFVNAKQSKIIFSKKTEDKKVQAAFYLNIKRRAMNDQAVSILDLCKDVKPLENEEEYREILFTEFKNAFPEERRGTLSYYTFDMWTKVLASQVNHCLEWLKGINSGSITGWGEKTAKDVDLKDLARELFMQALATATAIVNLHSLKAKTRQTDAKEIHDLHMEIDNLEKRTSLFGKETGEECKKIKELKEKKENLEKKFKEELENENSGSSNSKAWHTDNVYFSLVKNYTFLPVIGDLASFNRQVQENAENQIPKGIAQSTRRYWAYMREHFEKDFSGIENTNKGEDHKWFAYCLAQLSLSSEKAVKTDAEIKENFKRILDATKNFNEKKGYILTKLTYLKLCLMILKAELGTPIIIMGESGCGKTYLSQFLVKELYQEELVIISLYAGFEEHKLVYEIRKATKKANTLSESRKKLWIFFDEFNTTPLQGLIADVMLDRVVPSYYTKSAEAEKIPDNICFIACCNPFLIKLNKNQNANIGLVPNSKTSKLSHIVHPIPDRIISLVWDFGQLPESEEKMHILNMVKAERLFKKRSLHQALKLEERLTGFVQRSHNTVRKIEERSGVSLRDIKRVFLFYKWFTDQKDKLRKYYQSTEYREGHKKETSKENRIKPTKSWIFESDENYEIASAIAAITICYSLKFNGQDSQKDIINIIHKWANFAIGVRSITKEEATNCLTMIAEIYLHEIDCTDIIDNSIAINKPLKENFMTLLACYAVKVPIIIVGAPGTSKTLCSNILRKVVGPERKDEKKPLTLLENLPICTWIPYCGSETSTPATISRLFEKAENLNKQRTEGGTNDLPGIFFDELGLAEISPYNPLKVMHSKLEEFLQKIPFVSISNWKPDQSKINRMVCLSRPDLTKDDLINIFQGTISKLSVGHAPVREAVQCLSQTYLNYREWQKKNGLDGMYHTYFHGSRDIYATIKFINKNLLEKLEGQPKSNIESTPEERDQQNWKATIYCIVEAIERNLNGEIYNFDEKENKDSRVISIQNLKGVNHVQLVNQDFYDKILTTDYLKKKVIKTLDIHQKVNEKSEEQTLFTLSSSEVFKIFFLSLLYEQKESSFKKTFFKNDQNEEELDYFHETITDDDVMEKVKENINSTVDERGERIDCRFVALRTESSIEDDFIVEILRADRNDKKGKKGLIDLRSSNIKGKIEDILSQLKTYITEGYLVVMKNQDHIYAGLYELINQKYLKENECTIYYGLSRDTVKVHKDFKCVVILPTGANLRKNKLLEKVQPAPFLNRFEKYFIPLSSLIPESYMKKLSSTMKEAQDIFERSPSFFLGYNIDTLTTMFIDKDSLSKHERPSDEVKNLTDIGKTAKKRMNQLLTSNYVVDDKTELTSTDQRELKKVHENLTFKNKLEEEGNKVFIFTFTGPKKMTELAKAKGWSVISASDILNEGETDYLIVLKKLGESEIKSKKLIISFETANEFDIIRQLKYVIDTMDTKAMSADISEKGVSYESVMFLLHLTKNEKGRGHINESLGISYWNNWDIVTIENLEDTFNFNLFFNLKKKSMTVKDMILDSFEKKEILGEKILRRVIVTAIEGLNIANDFSQNQNNQKRNQISSGFKQDARIIREWVDLQDIEDKHQKRFISSLANLLINRLGDKDEKGKIIENGDDSSKKSQSYIDIELRMLHIFYNTYKDEVTREVGLVNSLCQNLSSIVRGISIFSSANKGINEPENEDINSAAIVEKYFAILDDAIEKTINPEEQEKKEISPLEMNESTGPRVLYLPFKAIFENINSKYRAELDKRGQDRKLEETMKKNSLRLYQQMLRLNKKEPDELISATEEQKLKSINLLQQEEYLIEKDLTNICKELFSSLSKENIKLSETSEFPIGTISSIVKDPVSAFKVMFMVDWLNSMNYNLPRNRYSFEILSSFIMLCFQLSNNVSVSMAPEKDYEQDKMEENEEGKVEGKFEEKWEENEEGTVGNKARGRKVANFKSGLIGTTIIITCFPEFAMDMLEYLTSSSLKEVEGIFDAVVTERFTYKLTIVDYPALYHLSSKLLSKKIPLNTESQIATKTEARKKADNIELTTHNNSNSIALLYRMVSMVKETTFKDWLTNLKNLLKSEGSIYSDTVLEKGKDLIKPILEAKKSLKKNLDKITKEELKDSEKAQMIAKERQKEQIKMEMNMIADCVADFIGIWIQNRRNFQILIGSKKGEQVSEVSEEYLSREELRRVMIRTMIEAHSWLGPFWKKDSLKKIKERIINTKDELNILDKFLKESEKSRYSKCYDELREILFIAISEADVKDSQDFTEAFVDLYEEYSKPRSLLQLLSVLVTRKYILIHANSAEMEKIKVNQILCKAIENDPSNILEKIVKPSNYPFAFLLQVLFQTQNSLESGAKNYKAIELTSEALNFKEDPSLIIVRDKNHFDEYVKLRDLFNKHLKDYMSNDPSTKDAAFKKLDELFKQVTLSSQENTLYLLGVVVLNTVLRLTASQEMEDLKKDRHAVHSFFKVALAKVEEKRQKYSLLCQMMIHLSVSDESTVGLDSYLSFDRHYLGSRIKEKKILATMGLLSICFDSFGYTPESWEKWSQEKKLSTTVFKAASNITEYTEYCLNVVEDRMHSRYDPNTKVQSLDFYKCSCSFIYPGQSSYGNQASINCPNCQLETGNETQKVNSLDEIIEIITKSPEANFTGIYNPHTPLDPNSSVFKLQRCIDLKTNVDSDRKEANNQTYMKNVYLRHLFDHMYLTTQVLFMPKESWTMFDEAQKTFVEQSHMENKLEKADPSAPLNYCMLHIKNDCERLASLLNFDSKTKLLEWLSAVLSQMGDNLIKNESVDKDVKLPIDQEAFQKPHKLIEDQNKIQLDRGGQPALSKAVISLLKQDYTNIPEEVMNKEQTQVFRKQFKMRQYDRNLIMSKFSEKIEHHKVIYIVHKYKPLLEVYPRLVSALVEICSYVHKEYSGKITREEAKEALIVSSPLCKPKGKLQTLFTEFKKVAHQINSKFKDQFPHLFNICSIGSDKELRVGNILEEETNEEKASIHHFAYELRENEMSHLQSIIAAMISNIHNRISEECEKELGIVAESSDPKNEMSETKGEESIAKESEQQNLLTTPIKEPAYADYVSLDKENKLEELVLENTVFDTEVTTDNVYLIDFKKINHTLAKMLYKKAIHVRAVGFNVFDFRDKIRIECMNKEVKKYFGFASADDLQLHQRELIPEEISKSVFNKESANFTKYLDTVANICAFLQSEMKFQFNREVKNVLLKIGDISDKEMSSKLLQEFSQAVERFEAPADMKIAELYKFYHELEKITVGLFINEHCKKMYKVDIGPFGEIDQIGDCIVIIKAKMNSKNKQWLQEIINQLYKFIATNYPPNCYLELNLNNPMFDLYSAGVREETKKLESEQNNKDFGELKNALGKLLIHCKLENWGCVEKKLNE